MIRKSAFSKILSLTFVFLIAISCISFANVTSNAIIVADSYTAAGTGNGGAADEITYYSSTSRWVPKENSFLYKTSSGYTAVDCGSSLFVTVYNSNFNKISSKTITMNYLFSVVFTLLRIITIFSSELKTQTIMTLLK